MTVSQIAAEYGLSESTVRRKCDLIQSKIKRMTFDNGSGQYKREVKDYMVSDVRKVFGKKPK